MSGRSPSLAGLLLAAVVLAAGDGFAAAANGAGAPPRLVLVVVVDQLRPDRLGSELPGGLGRLVREGRVHSDAVQDHAMTETCPGHATILTGQHPATAGIPANSFFDPTRSRVVYCADDASPEAAVIGAEGEGRSPKLLRVETLGDWMHRADPRTRVFSVSGKDRAAIMLGGQKPDGAYWFRGQETRAFTTSRHYRPVLPAWVERFNGADAESPGFLSTFPESWVYAPLAGDRIDDFPGESEQHSRTSPHPVRASDRAVYSAQLFASPFLDIATLEFARRLVEEEGLGSDSVPDLLAVSLSATDVVGHHYGPYSVESRDALARLDAAFGRFLADLERRVGGGGLLVVLTADHGVLPLPEWLEAQGRAECPVAGGRIGLKRLGLGLLGSLHLQHSALRWPRPWLLFAGSQMAIDRSLAAERGVDPAEVARTAEARLEPHPGIAAIWNATEIRQGEGEIARLYRNSYDPERAGDMVVQVNRGCLISSYDGGTTHGTPYLYDRAVPLVFWGAGVKPGIIAKPARTIDVAPTLARLLGVAPTTPLAGTPLF